MSIRRLAAVQTGLLLAAMLANAASVKNTVRITVLDSVTRLSNADNNNGVPLNCEQLTYDAYCRSTTNPPLISTLLVQEGNEPPFRISCTIESRYSRCMPLAKGESFDARREKRGLTVYFVDDKGKERKQLYTLVASDKKQGPVVPAAAVATQPVGSPHTVAAVQSSPAPATVPVPAPAAAPAPSPAAAQSGLPGKVEKVEVEKVRCKFSSTPSGAEITLDGQYVGSTPSEISISTGTHVVLFSMPGFAQWKRELTVSPGSELTVSAILQK
jgi:PEGA domain